MSHVLRMRTVHHRRLAELLQAAIPRESVAFLLCRRAAWRDGVVYLVDEVLGVDPGEYALQSPEIASVSPTAMVRIAKRARTAGRVIAMAHLHPMVDSGVEFSGADFLGNRRSFTFFHRRVLQPEHLSLVWNGSIDECAGLIYRSDGEPIALDAAIIVDEERWIDCVASTGVASARFARQAMLLGAAGQRCVEGVHAAIIGAGGVGSLASLALVHHGIRRLTIVDDEVLDETNPPRVVASVPSDIGRRSKVDIAADYAEAHAPNVVVRRVNLHVEHPDVLEEIVGADVIVLCTDNTTSRAHINQLSQQYLIPVVDLGVQFAIASDGSIANEVGRINLIRPGSPCMWCSGHISPERLAAEAVPRIERERERSYLRGFDDPQPSMLAFNMEIVGRGMQVLLGYLTGLMSPPELAFEQRTFLTPRGGLMSRLIGKAHRTDCPVCRNVGCGEETPMVISNRAA